MTAGTQSEFKIYNDEFFGGMTETLMQVSDAFNGASRNAIRLVPTRHRGEFEKESFIKEIANLITRRDTTSISAASDLKLEQGELVGVKIDRKIGPVAQTLDAFRKISSDPRVFSFLLGQQTAKAVSVDMINAAINGLAAAIGNVGALVVANHSDTMIHGHLAEANSTFGDRAQHIICYVMHSKPSHDLLIQAIDDKITNVADVAIVEGNTATLGRPVVVIDSPSLVVAGTPDTYITLALVENAAEVSESEDREIVSDMVTGLENLVMRIQGEYAFSLKLKGYTWDVTNGHANPTDGSIGTGSNWDLVAADNKSTAGVYMI